jgi:hypothetical protein
MEDNSPQGHLEAAARHEQAARSHERIATYWTENGDDERAALQRELADYERVGAELERRWAALVEKRSAAAD